MGVSRSLMRSKTVSLCWIEMSARNRLHAVEGRRQPLIAWGEKVRCAWIAHERIGRSISIHE